jgi:hypothetical protein
MDPSQGGYPWCIPRIRDVLNWRMKMKGICWILLVPGLLAGCSSGSTTFTFKPKVGETATYAMKIEGTIGAQPMNVDGTLTVTNKDAGSGNIDVETTLTGIPGAGHTTVETVDSSGKVIKSTVDGKPAPGGGAVGNSTREMMPTHPVKVGDTWSGSRNVNGKPVTADYKLTKLETVGGVELATVELTKLDIPGGKLTEPGKIVIEPATGTLHSTSVSLSMTMNGQTITQKVSMEKN